MKCQKELFKIGELLENLPPFLMDLRELSFFQRKKKHFIFYIKYKIYSYAYVMRNIPKKQ